jgi:predicted RNase H-like HicB family nuclease
MDYPVIVERKNGIWRAFIPVLSGLAGEGRSRDEAVRNAQRAAEDYLASVELTTISVPLRTEPSRQGGKPAGFAEGFGDVRRRRRSVARALRRDRRGA